jgi:hypothetical protein
VAVGSWQLALQNVVGVASASRLLGLLRLLLGGWHCWHRVRLSLHLPQTWVPQTWGRPAGASQEPLLMQGSCGGSIGCLLRAARCRSCVPRDALHSSCVMRLMLTTQKHNTACSEGCVEVPPAVGRPSVPPAVGRPSVLPMPAGGEQWVPPPHALHTSHRAE